MGDNSPADLLAGMIGGSSAGRSGGSPTNNKSIEDLMSKLASTSLAKNAPTVKKRIVVDDFLSTAEKPTQSHPTYITRIRSTVQKGFSFGTGTRNTETTTLGLSSPGPLYNAPSFTEHPVRAQSFPKAPRHFETSHKDRMSTPGPHYDIPGCIGKQLTSLSAPGMKIDLGPRFTDSEYLSAAHSKSMAPRGNPGPAAYSVTVTPSSPSYSLAASGRPDLTKKQIFISKLHSESEGIGLDSPGPKYARSHEFTRTGAPVIGTKDIHINKRPLFRGSQDASNDRFANNMFISRAHDKCEPGRDSPGPGIYKNEPPIGGDKPSYSFGVLENPDLKRFYSRDLIGGPMGESPGPKYNPKDDIISKAVPGCVFATKDPLLASQSVRFVTKMHLGPGLSTAHDAASPGPAKYATAASLQFSSTAPAFTMGRREKVLARRICPAPERARYISKELMKENLGSYSPGPKYKIPDTLGGAGSIKHSFGISDRSFEDFAVESKEKMGTIEKPYTAPSEARFISAPHAKAAMLGRFSPGPMYNPNLAVINKKPPAHILAGRWKDTGEKPPTTEEREEERRKARGKAVGLKDVTFKSCPSTKFGTSKRGLLSGEESKTKNFAGKDSPGPVYRPNFESIEAHRPSAALGSLR